MQTHNELPGKLLYKNFNRILSHYRKICVELNFLKIVQNIIGKIRIKYSGERVVALHINKRLVDIVNHHIAVFE